MLSGLSVLELPSEQQSPIRMPIEECALEHRQIYLDRGPYTLCRHARVLGPIGHGAVHRHQHFELRTGVVLLLVVNEIHSAPPSCFGGPIDPDKGYAHND